jgi:predicted RNA binding protein YcfA (HicA-like mRNA interferase family)
MYKLPKLQRLTPEEAEKRLLRAGFLLIRSKGSHRIYQREKERFVLPFHRGKILHPKIVKALIELVGDSNG